VSIFRYSPRLLNEHKTKYFQIGQKYKIEKKYFHTLLLTIFRLGKVRTICFKVGAFIFLNVVSHLSSIIQLST